MSAVIRCDTSRMQKTAKELSTNAFSLTTGLKLMQLQGAVVTLTALSSQDMDIAKGKYDSQIQYMRNMGRRMGSYAAALSKAREGYVNAQANAILAARNIPK